MSDRPGWASSAFRGARNAIDELRKVPSKAGEPVVVEVPPSVPEPEKSVVVEPPTPLEPEEPVVVEVPPSASESEKSFWNRGLGVVARIAAGAATAFALAKRLFRKREEAPTPPAPPSSPIPDAPKTPIEPEAPPEDEQTGEMSKLLEKFAGRVTDTLNTYANREDEQNTHFWERWMATWGRRLNETTQVDNEYRNEQGMQELDAQTRVARAIAVLIATAPAMAADLLIPMAVGDTLTDAGIMTLRDEIYEGLTGDKLGSTATQIAELAASFVPGVTSLNLGIAGLYELATLSRRGGRIEKRFGNKRLGKIMKIVQGILNRRNAKNPAPAAA